MRTVVKFALLSTLLIGAHGCSPGSSEGAAEDARLDAADARVEAATANARADAADANVKAADARVRVADADVRAADARVNAADADIAADAAAARVKDPVGLKEREYERTIMVLPSGTVLKVSLIDALSSDASLAGDRFLAGIAESVVVNGVTLLPVGGKIRGRVVEVERAGKVQGRAAIMLELTDILRDGRMIPITTRRFEVEADSSTGRDAGIVAGGAGVGAVVGAIIGGKKGAAIGAATGGGGGAGVVLATKGNEIQSEPETRLDFTLANSVQL